jgi:hypothetical protein
MKKELLDLQSFLLTAGTLFAGYNFVVLVNRYLLWGGSFAQYRIAGGLVNPLLTPCFWGLVVFLLALIWTVTLRMNYSKASQYKLIWLIAAGAIFAWGNYGYELARIYGGKVCNLGCTAGYFGMPWFVSCLVGAAIFTLTLITALALRRRA